MKSCGSGAARVLFAAACAAALALGATACGGSAAPAAGSAASPSTAGVEQPTMSSGTQVLRVTGTETLEFLQTHLAAKAGVPVRIEFTVTGGVPHNLTLLNGPKDSGPKAATPTFSSGTRSITVTFATPGTYHYQCTIHPGSMNGTITVS